MLRVLLIITFVITTSLNFGFCQKSEADIIYPSNIGPLKEKLKQAQNIHQKIDYNLGISLAYFTEIQDFSNALKYAEEALSLSEENKLLAYKAISTTFKERVFFYQGQDFSISNLEKSIEWAFSIDNPQAICQTISIYSECQVNNDKDQLELLNKLINKYGEYLSATELGISYFERGFIQYENGNFKEAESDYLTAIKLFENSKPTYSSELEGVSSLQSIANNYYLINTLLEYSLLSYFDNKPDVALSAINKAFNHAKYKNDLARCYQDLGYIQLNNGEFDKVATNLNEAISLFEEMGNPTAILGAKRDLSDFYILIKEYEKADEVLIQIGMDFPHISNFEKALNLKLRANANELQENFKTSSELYLEAAELFKKSGDRIGYRQSQIELSNNLFQLGQLEKSENILLEFIPMLIANNEDRHLIKAYSILAQIYSTKGDSKKSIEFANKVLSSDLNNEKAKIDKRSAHKLLSKVYEKDAQYALSLEHLKQYHENENLFEDALAVNKENEYQNKVNEYILKEQESKAETLRMNRQRKTYLFIALGLFGLLSVGIYLFRQLQQARNKLSIQNDDLEALNKTKDKFFALIAHDIRNPIYALKDVDKQMKYYATKGDQHRMLKVSDLVGKTSNKVLDLLDNLLKWALSESNMIQYNPEAINLKQAVKDTMNLLDTSAMIKNITFKNEVGDSLILNTDKNALLTIIRNLMTNSIKYSDDGDTVSIGATENLNQIVFYISDTGAGMSEKQVQDIFKLVRKVNQGTRGEKGTGLGLVLVKELVHLINGKIQVESQLGKGSTFTISIPK